MDLVGSIDLLEPLIPSMQPELQRIPRVGFRGVEGKTAQPRCRQVAFPATILVSPPLSKLKELEGVATKAVGLQWDWSS